MAFQRKIRKNILTNEWEHFVPPITSRDEGYWAPGIYHYSGQTETDVVKIPLNRNIDDFLISYEDIIYEDYKTEISRDLIKYDDLAKYYEIKFNELYNVLSMTVEFEIVNPTLETIDIKAEINGGLPIFDNENKYNIIWSAKDFNANFNKNWSQEKTSILSKVGIGKYKIKVIDANFESVENEIVILPQHFLKPKPAIIELDNIVIDLKLYVDESFTNYDGRLVATITGGTKPYDIVWVGQSVNFEEVDWIIFKSNILNNVGPGYYKIIVTDSLGNVQSADIKLVPHDFRVVETYDEIQDETTNLGLTLSGTIIKPTDLELNLGWERDNTASTIVRVPETMSTTSTKIDKGQDINWVEIIEGSNQTGDFNLVVKTIEENDSPKKRSMTIRISDNAGKTYHIDINVNQNHM